MFQLILVIKNLKGKDIQDIMVTANLEKYSLVQEEKKIDALINDIGFEPNHSEVEESSMFCLLFMLGLAYLIVSVVLMFL